MVRHALSREDKEARRDRIFEEALNLFLRDTRRLPTVAAIAAGAGLAKGTVYLYFETKEQIFAALLTREWSLLLTEVQRAFAEGAVSAHARIARFIERYAAFLDSHGYFLELDALGYALLEANLPRDQFMAFKKSYSETIDEAAVTVETSLNLQNGRGRELLTRTYAMTRGLWQVAVHPDDQTQTDRGEVSAASRRVFHTDLKSALNEYWRGAYPMHLTEFG